VDVNKLKGNVDKAIEEKQELQRLQERVISKYNEFRNICDELGVLITEVLNSKRESLFNEFVNYFKGNGFEVSQEGNVYKASYKDVIVSLVDEDNEGSVDEYYFTFDIKSQNIYTGIVIKADYKSNSMIYQKRHLKYNDRYIEFKNAKETFASISDVNALNKIISDIEINISWYKQTINNFSKIEFVYSLYKTDKGYNTFKELFEAL
jgi:hypothetical protein